MNKIIQEKSPAGYFTAGELASMYDISKQSLLYYDRVGLLAPDFISENGYRHYSIDQYLDLEIIVNLRKLGLSINDIRSYLKNRSRDSLQALLRKRDEECQKMIRENERIRRSICAIDQKIRGEKDAFVPKDFNLRKREERLLRIDLVKDLSSDKERVVLFAKASHKNIHNRSILEKNPGWIISGTEFLQKKDIPKALGFFTVLPGRSPSLMSQEDFLHRHKDMHFSTLPAGLYCETTFYGPFREKAAAISRQLDHFLHQHKLLPEGNIYVQPVKNHWVTTDLQQYITRLFLKVTAG